MCPNTETSMQVRKQTIRNVFFVWQSLLMLDVLSQTTNDGEQVQLTLKCDKYTVTTTSSVTMVVQWTNVGTNKLYLDGNLLTYGRGLRLGCTTNSLTNGIPLLGNPNGPMSQFFAKQDNVVTLLPGESTKCVIKYFDRQNGMEDLLHINNIQARKVAILYLWCVYDGKEFGFRTSGLKNKELFLGRLVSNPVELVLSPVQR